MSGALPAIGEPSAAARAVVENLLLDDIADLASTLAALAVLIGAAAKRRDLQAIRTRFGGLRAVAFTMLVDIRALDDPP
jgi:hypothetical protein